MGGRGSSAKKSSGGSEAPKVDYKPRMYGQITRFEAGVIYRATKEGNIKTLPETTKSLYRQTEDLYRLATSRYQQEGRYYDRIYAATEHILNKNYTKAQDTISAWEKERIERSGKRSPFYKYKRKRD